jgi:AcrR family transcriptional regulator
MKKAELTKTLLIDATLAAIAEAGATTFTLENIAKRAGISKGALLHHFATRSVLIEAVIKERVDQFWHKVQELILVDEDAHGRVTRAYVRAITDTDGALSRAWRGLSTAFVTDPSLMHLWRDTLRHYQSGIEAEGNACSSVWIARLASDSLWTSELFGNSRISPTARETLVCRLIELTYPEVEVVQRKAA